MNKLVWYSYAVDYVLRRKCQIYRKHKKYSKANCVSNGEASEELSRLLVSNEPFMAGRIGLFEMAAMRMYEFGKKDKYEIVMNNIYNCAGFFPNDITLGDRFTRLMKESLSNCDILASDNQLCENYFINSCMNPAGFVAKDLGLFDVCIENINWSEKLQGKKVLVVTPFTESVEHQYRIRERLFVGTQILPEFELKSYKSLMTVGDLRDDRFETWFEALEFMKKEILAMDFDVALLGCGAYGFPLASAIKESGRAAIHMGGALQILFGIMGKRWDGTRTSNEISIRKDIAPYYNDSWIYPLESKPDEASKVEYGPYWR